MKKTLLIPAIFFAGLLASCEKNTSSLKEAELASANTNSSGRIACMTSDPKQQDCDKVYAPVCACNSQTYANACEAQNAGLLNWVKGTCDENGGGYPGGGVNVRR
jgi:hypothetical protein